jgi:cyclophilin family peptidyl-prolyl cis-trans isomerase
MDARWMNAWKRIPAAVLVIAGGWHGLVVGAQAKPDAAAAKAEFDTAGRELKELVSDMTVLQAQYHQPKADRDAIEARFKEASTKAVAASERFEAAALALAVADPSNAEAKQVTGEAIKGAVRADAPEVALEKASKLQEAGVADGDTCLVAATAAIIASQLDAATDWLEQAKAKGARKDRVGELEQAIERDRLKVDEEMAKRKADAEADDRPRVKLSTSAGDLVVELFEDEAPNTVANFVSLVEKGYYDGTPFHRVISGFMAQGGDPTGTGGGGPGYAIACEVDRPGTRKHFRGTLSMAHAGENTGGSQFFLTFRPTEHLDGKHTVFGRVIEGMDALPRIMRTMDEQGRSVPGVEPDTITKATVLRKRNHPYVPETLPAAQQR